MKKLFILVFAIALCLCLGVLCVGASADYNGTPSQPDGSGSAANPYQIGTAEELYWFAGLVNGDKSIIGSDTPQNTSANAVLTADITINENVLNEDGELNSGSFTQWTPICGKEIGKFVYTEYTGTFDGGGHSISGLYYYGSGDYVGLFGFVGSGGRVQNVKVTDSYISNSEGTGRTGGVCGYNNGTITNCCNTGAVTGSGRVGGVCGGKGGMSSNCYNAGAVTGSGTNTYVGGVCGYNNGTITNCCNTGAVTGGERVGGVCGHNFDGTITSCYNTGAVTGSGRVGGVCGGNGGMISNCYNAGAVTGSGNVGGVCGLNNGTITNCYWLSSTATKGIGAGSGEATEKREVQFKSGEVAWLLNSSTNGPWRQNLGEGGDAFPVLDSTHGEVVKLTVDGEVSYRNSGDKFEGEDGKVYYDNKGERAEVPCEVTADTTLTSKTLVTVTADSFDCFVGDDKPTLTYTTSPVVEGLNVTLECDANMYAVGEYTITISGLETDDSYDFDYVNGVLKVRDSYVVTVDGEVHYVHPGGSFTIPDAPKNGGYIFLGWRCGDETYKAGETIKVTSDMTFTAVWGNLPDVDPEEPEPEPELPFYDVAKGDWFYDAVKYVYCADLMDGVEEHIFAPNDTLTRAMVWTIIARAEGVDTDGGATWYAKAQEWVVAKGISDGENPSAAITRQELVTMLWRLAGEPVVNYALTAPDADAISGWAYEAMRWAVSEGIIEGDENGLIHPTTTCTRAEAAAILMRLG